MAFCRSRLLGFNHSERCPCAELTQRMLNLFGRRCLAGTVIRGGRRAMENTVVVDDVKPFFRNTA